MTFAQAGKGLREPLHNSLRSVVKRTRAARCVVFLTNSLAIGCKKTPCSPSRSDCHSLARVMQRLPSVEPFTMLLTCFHDRTRHPFS